MSLYNFWRSSCSWRVRACLAMKNVDYKYLPIDLFKDGGEQKKPEYLEINPMGQIPFLVDGDADVAQSMAILEYIDEKYKNPPLLPKDVKSRAKVREICGLITSGIQPLQHRKVLGLMTSEDAKLKWAHDCVASGFESLEKILQKSSGKYCVGDNITMADLCLVPQAYNAVDRFSVDLNKFSVISRIYLSLEENPSFKKSHPLNQPDCPIQVL
ncbi:unnamed protein product [Clavelina lepadiformis]|uniref:maleylacetoacetate isomerase n=1 Tax=Clavelina lepadiformis TaxID=159417 RepID=A0ABP0F7I0_CLALP